MVIKYGKAYDGRNNFVDLWLLGRCHNRWKLARKRKQWSVFFWNLLSEQRLKFFLYWTPSDIVQHKEKALGEKEVAGFIHMEPLIEVRKTPLVANPSPFVLDATKATLKIIEENTVEELSQKSDSPSKTLVTSPPPDDTANTFYAPVRHRPVCHHNNRLMGCRRNHGNHGNHGLKKNTDKGRSHPPRSSPQFVNGNTSGTLQQVLLLQAWSLQCTLDCWPGNIYKQTGRLIILQNKWVC